jgi:hypothetical protein
VKVKGLWQTPTGIANHDNDKKRRYKGDSAYMVWNSGTCKGREVWGIDAVEPSSWWCFLDVVLRKMHWQNREAIINSIMSMELGMTPSGLFEDKQGKRRKWVLRVWLMAPFVVAADEILSCRMWLKVRSRQTELTWQQVTMTMKASRYDHIACNCDHAPTNVNVNGHF